MSLTACPAARERFVIDPEAQGLISLAEVPALLPRRTHAPVAACTIRRWSKEGVLKPDGSRIKLPTIRAGAQVLTSKQALTWFMRTLADAE